MKILRRQKCISLENSHWVAEIQGADYSVIPRYYHNDDAEALADDRKEGDLMYLTPEDRIKIW